MLCDDNGRYLIMAKRLGTIPGLWHTDLAGGQTKGGTVTVNNTGQSVFFDAEGLIPMQDPIPLDSMGSAVAYISGDADYTFTIKDSDGTTLHTVANTTAIPSPSRLINNLDVNGNSIVSSSAGDITITSDGNGNIVLDGQKWPKLDGAANTVLSTDGNNNLTLSDSLFNLVNDTTPQLGGDLDTNSFNILFNDGDGFTDDSGNSILLFNKTTNAVNYTQVTNASTGNGPILAAEGDDTNIDLHINGKGSGNVSISGNKYPNSDGNNNDVLHVENSNILLGFDDAATVFIGRGGASEMDMESASSPSKIIPVDKFVHHPGIAKAWAITNSMNGGTTPEASFNISSHTATDIGGTATQEMTFTFDTAMANTNYCVFILPTHTSTTAAQNYTRLKTRSTTSFTIVVQRSAHANDTTDLSVMVLGAR